MLLISTFIAAATAAQPDAGSFSIEETLARAGPVLTPQEVVARAWAVAPELAEARARVEAAAAAVRSAEIPIAPRLSVFGDLRQIGGFADGAIASPIGEISIAIPRTRAGVTAQLDYPVSDVFFRILPRIRSRQARQRAEDHRRRGTRQELALRALEAYWTVAEARGRVAVATAGLEQAKAQRQRGIALQRAGRATAADLASVEARWAEAEQVLTQAEAAQTVAGAAFALLVDWPESSPYAFPRALLEPPDLEAARSASDLEASAAADRPELQALSDAVAAVDREKSSTWAGRLPRLDLQGTLTYAQPNPNIIPPQERFDSSWAVGARLGWSPNDLWAAERADEQLDADRARLEAERERLWRAVRLEIRVQRESLASSAISWVAAQSRVRAAEAAYRARAAALAGGRAIWADVLASDAELSAARLSRLTALVDAHLARARLDRAIGRRSAASSSEDG